LFQPEVDQEQRQGQESGERVGMLAQPDPDVKQPVGLIADEQDLLSYW
jgi:hypothetical protein